MPAAQRMPARMSESRPPHLPSTRTGSTQTFQPNPAMPTELLVRAPTMPETRVPCQLLDEVLQEESSAFERSLSSNQSPASEASAAQSLPSLLLGPDTKS